MFMGTVAKAISGMTTATSRAKGDYGVIVDVSAATEGTKKTILTEFMPNAAATDQGATGNSDTIKYAVDTIGSDTGTIKLLHNSSDATTTYTVTTAEVIPANIILEVENGALIDGTLTIYSPAKIKAGAGQQIFAATATIAFTVKNGWVDPFWFGMVNDPADDSTDSGTALNAALATGCNVRIPAGTYSTTTGIVQNTTGQTVEAYGVTLRVNADVIGWQLGVTGGASNKDRCNLIGDIRIDNVSGSSTKAAIRVESIRYSTIEYYFLTGFNFGAELIASGAVGCVYNDIYAGYNYVDDATDGYGIYLNHVSDVAGYIYNNRIHAPKVFGTGKYGIYIKKRASGSDNVYPKSNQILGGVYSGTYERSIYDGGDGTFVLGGHYEQTLSNSNAITGAGWEASGSGTNEYYYNSATIFPDGVVPTASMTVKESATALTWGALGSLVASGFGYGDNDSLGFNTIYVRTAAGADPDVAGDITYIDTNAILLSSDSSNAYIDITHDNLTARNVTNQGSFSTINSAAMVRKYFQDSGNSQSMYFKRVGAQGAAGNSPMLTLNDSNAVGTTYSQVLELIAGETDTTSYYLRGKSVAGAIKFRIDGAGNYLNVATPDTLTGAGAVSITTPITWLVTTGANALTLADGQEGQHKYIIVKTDGGAGTLTPTTPAGFATLLFDTVGDSAHLLFTNAAWHFMGGTATVG